MEAQFQRNQSRRFAAEARAYDRLTAQINAASPLVGQLSTGEYYINVRSKAGALTGKVRRFQDFSSATHFLIRNRYV